MRRRGFSINQRVIISSVLALAVAVALVSTISQARKPVLGVSLGRADTKRVVQVQKPVQNPDRGQQLPRYECGSTAFIDYAEGATGKATPMAAVRAYRPGAQDLRVQTLGSDRALVEEFRGQVKIAGYEVFRVDESGWLVTRADTYEPCVSPQ